MGSFEVELENNSCLWLLPVLKDNYIFVFQANREDPHVIVVDPAEARPVNQFLSAKGLTIKEIWITHHHSDHTLGVKDLVKTFSCPVRGSSRTQEKIAAITEIVDEESQWVWGSYQIKTLFLPGHTLDHVAYWVQASVGTVTPESLLFSGDLLFGLGCGRVFEGSYEMALASLQKINRLPGETKVFCTHEYTENNLKFTLAQREWVNGALLQRQEKIQSLREKGLPTVPLTLSEERETNIFLRILENDDPLALFSLWRERRNSW